MDDIPGAVDSLASIASPGSARDEGDILDQLDGIERKLAQMQRLVTIGTLAAGAVHEINNLLTPVVSYAHMARSGQRDPARLDRSLEKVIAGVEAACGVAQAMLNYSRDTQDGQSACVSDCLDAAVGCLARDPARDNILLSRRIEPDVAVAMRPLALQQVLLNLILNAREAMKPRGGGQITIEAVEEAGSVTILVADDGPGIPEELLGTIFDPFVTSNSDSGAIRIGGAGLGLTVTRYLVEKAMGTIEAQSLPGSGAAFSIKIPAASKHDRA
jgi:signal transduction histidine kinase